MPLSGYRSRKINNLEPREADLSGRAPVSASGLSPSPRQVPDLAGEARCQGSARSEAEGRIRPQAVAPLTGSFRGDRIARRGEDGPAALAGAVIGVRDGGTRLAAGTGERRCGGGPRRASQR
jgi:hypothetical protein